VYKQEPSRKGLIIVHTGQGKGKTTAALGLLLRAWGQNMRPCVIQFLKHEKGPWGEIKVAEQLGIEWHTLGDGFTWTSKDIHETADRVREGWELAQTKIASGEYDLVLLDEFTYAFEFGWVDVMAVIHWLREHKPPATHVLITGRGAPPELVAFADLVTEMLSIKHPFDQGILAQAGIEF